MIPFAVSVEGLTSEGRAIWVLAIDGDRLLLAHEDRTLHWHPLAECSFAKLIDPEAPKAVVPVQAQRPLAIPNRAMRRELERNGA